jgi:putative membrane protein
MRKYILTFFKGLAMGAADVIPGVSGGTIAFLTGIYAELLNSIKSINWNNLKLLFSGKFKEFSAAVNLKFLMAVGGGIIVSIFSLARLMQYLLVHHPIPLWSFFMGLIAASAIYVLKEIKKWSLTHFISLLAGIAVAAWICLVSPSQTTEAYWFIFLSGVIAICAMILPGISGSFILLLLGKYAFIMKSVTEFNIPVLITFAIGAAIGIVTFSHFLTWLLKKYYKSTLCVLAGFMIGSLVKVWPWKRIIDEASHIDRPILPGQFETITGQPAQLGLALLFIAIGFSIVFLIEFMAKSLKK